MAYDLAHRQKPGELEIYDPERGLDRISVAKVAEDRYTKAKDLAKLSQAVTLKLTEQRNFVVWWDGQEKGQGRRDDLELPFSSARKLTTSDLGVDSVTLHRWRTRLKPEDKFGNAIEAALERCRRVCEAEKGSTEQRGASGTGDNEWYTPADIIERARIVLGEIDLDPASSRAAQAVVKATRFFTKEEDGLAQNWTGRVWLNPPYAQPFVAQFVSKMVQERLANRIPAAIMLTNNSTDTAWFHEAAAAADAICFTRGRIKFHHVTGKLVDAPIQGQAFFYFGTDVPGFAAGFRDVGFVVAPIREDAP